MGTPSPPGELTGRKKAKHVDWAKFGLASEDGHHGEEARRPPIDEDYYGGRASEENELFAEEQGDKPWWKSQFFISEPVLFGTWDGVFTSCMINIFGVIVFLRAGWMVGEAGVGQSMLIVLATVLITLVSVLSGIGICERTRMKSGGIYFLLAQVLGSRTGGAFGLVYCFGQAVGCALYVTGFSESMAELLHTDDPWVERGVAVAVIVLLCGINIAGVKWVIKLQFLLLVTLLLAALDFAVGSFIHTDYKNGFDGWESENFRNNTKPGYTDGNNWFTVFGVFFPTMTGIMAGINMSGDLRHPARDIPVGTLASVAVSSMLYVMFVLVLAATCARWALLSDYMIAAKVSAVGVLLLSGLYVSSASSCLATLYGTPRVLQSIANENVIPVLSALGRGRGPNKVPVLALVVVSLVTLVFILIGQINRLAPIVTMPFMLTYAAIDYSYFALAQTSDLQTRREKRFRSQGVISPTFDTTKDSGPQSYGAIINDKESAGKFADDLDKLFPERIQHKKITHQHSSATSSLVSSPDEHSSIKSFDMDASPEACLKKVAVKEDSEPEAALTDMSTLLQPARPGGSVDSKPHTWYSHLCNRWLSLLGCVVKIVIMFLVHWTYAILNLLAVLAIWLYIGQASPGVSPGLAAEFSFYHWSKSNLLILIGKKPQDYEQMVVTPMHPGVETMAAQLTEDNEDFASRSRYHQSSTTFHGKQFDDYDED